MTLINRLTIWYLIITTLVLLVGGFIVFNRVSSEIETEVSRRLGRTIDHVAGMLQEGVPADSIQEQQTEIKRIDFERPIIENHVRDSMGIFSSEWAVDRKFSVTRSYKIDGVHYKITAYNFIAEPDEIFEGIVASMIATLGILLIFFTLASTQLSKRILSNFNKTLKTIQSFSLKQNKAIRLEKTRIKEFKELNQFVEKMTNKALYDYRSLKEFSENASHELQTPLAIIRGKLELLLETNIDERQALLISGIQEAVQKLSTVNQSLILLTRLENQEYHQHQLIHFSEVVQKAIESFGELIEMKSLVIVSNVQPNVFIQLNPVLADILITNLLSNAIRHNVPHGDIAVNLSQTSLTVRNTGEEPRIDTSELFKRFKKGRQGSDSTGLGLAIVKQICDVSGHHIQYTFADGRHCVEIEFQPNK